jgi:hypothetical protein
MYYTTTHYNAQTNSMFRKHKDSGDVVRLSLPATSPSRRQLRLSSPKTLPVSARQRHRLLVGTSMAQHLANTSGTAPSRQVLHLAVILLFSRTPPITNSRIHEHITTLLEWSTVHIRKIGQKSLGQHLTIR